MRTSIHIGTLRFYAHHGVLPQEQKVGNYFKVETTLYTDFSRALVTDELTDTLNYAEVCQIISDEMAIPSRLLEHVAGRIINSLRSHTNVVLLSQIVSFVWTILRYFNGGIPIFL